VSRQDGAALPAPGEVTALLAEVREGSPEAWERLVALVYADLRRIARAHLRGRGRRETLQTTALVHEAWLRLARPSEAGFHDRVHFLAVASRAMRQVLLDHARARGAAKRSGNEVTLDIERQHPAAPGRGAELLALEAALVELERVEPRLGRVVEMRFFGGMTAEEVALVLGLSDRTIKSDWRKARAFLEVRLAAEGIGPRGATLAAEPDPRT
jgi:RNA polymerase sigma factor (TIGR02999 family)